MLALLCAVESGVSHDFAVAAVPATAMQTVMLASVAIFPIRSRTGYACIHTTVAEPSAQKQLLRCAAMNFGNARWVLRASSRRSRQKVAH